MKIKISHFHLGGLTGKFELEESLEVMLGVIKLVNDSLHQPNIKGLPEELFPLGSLVYQGTFLVLTIKVQSQACVSISHKNTFFLKKKKTYV